MVELIKYTKFLPIRGNGDKINGFIVPGIICPTIQNYCIATNLQDPHSGIITQVFTVLKGLEEIVGKPRILVVEDEAIISRDIVMILESMQYHPVCAVRTADDAITKAREHAPDLILMDIHIRGTMDGVGAARIIRDELHIPVIFVTSFGDEATITRAKEINPHGYVLKPFSDCELKSALDSALSQKMDENSA
jgi:CheY-like chemotaxis protein